MISDRYSCRIFFYTCGVSDCNLVYLRIYFHWKASFWILFLHWNGSNHQNLWWLLIISTQCIFNHTIMLSYNENGNIKLLGKSFKVKSQKFFIIQSTNQELWACINEFICSRTVCHILIIMKRLKIQIYKIKIKNFHTKTYIILIKYFIEAMISLNEFTLYAFASSTSKCFNQSFFAYIFATSIQKLFKLKPPVTSNVGFYSLTRWF